MHVKRYQQPSPTLDYWLTSSRLNDTIFIKKAMIEYSVHFDFMFVKN